MTTYYNILVAVDFAGFDDQLIDAALRVASEVSDITLINVLEPLVYPADNYLSDVSTTVTKQLTERGENLMRELAQKHKLREQSHLVASGRAATEIHRVAADRGCNLIVVGSHGRHGMQLLLGSTANAVLHGAGCDVLAVRIKDPSWNCVYEGRD